MSDSSENAVTPAATPDSTDTSTDTVSTANAADDVAQLVEKLIRAKRLTYGQYQTLSKMVLADGTVDEQERRQINRLFDAIQSGAIRIVE